MAEKLDPNFFEVIDTLAHEYGWSVEYIQSLELTEINDLLKAILKRKTFEWRMECYIVNCAMTGKQPKLDNTPEEEPLERPPENEQLIKLCKELGIKAQKV